MAGWWCAVRSMPEPKHFGFIRRGHYGLPEMVLQKAFSPETSDVFLSSSTVKSKHRIASERKRCVSPFHLPADLLPQSPLSERVIRKWFLLKWKWAQSYGGCSIWACYLDLADIWKALSLLSNPRGSRVWQFHPVIIYQAAGVHKPKLGSPVSGVCFLQ